jgi:flagellar motility protein MotE (MotC chaperone)
MPNNSGNSSTKVENPKSQNNAPKGKGVLFTLLTFMTVIVIIAAVFGGVFYFIIHNNVNGLADRYRSSIQNIPLAKLALPKVADPLDPKYMTAAEIKKKYAEFKNENQALKKQLADANAKLNEFQGYKDDYEGLKSDTDKALEDIKSRESAVNEKETQLKELKQKIDELIAKGDKDSFKTYYESLDPENAKLLYSQVVKEQQSDENIKKFAQVYAAMDAAAAAQIFEQLGNSKIDMTAETLKAMSKENSSAILASMTPAFAAKVTEKLNALYRGN